MPSDYTYGMRVMDGVIRTGALPVMPAGDAAAVLARPLPVVPPLGPGARMDGLGRRLAAAMPVPAPLPAAEPAPVVRPGVPPWRRPAIAFSLLLPALVIAAAGVTLTHRTAAPADRLVATSRPAAASAPSPNHSRAVSAAAAAAQSAKLQSLLSSFTAGRSEQYGIVVKDLTTGAAAASGADTVMNSASLYKLFVAQRILAGVDTGKYTLGQAAGDQFGRNIDQCLRLMITISDNNCGVALGNLIGWQDQNKALATLGFTHTDLKTLQQTSASDVARYFERLYNGTLLSPSSTQYLMNLLKSQQVNNRLPQGLPAGTVIAHKTGDLWDVVHDAGIVYGPKGPYLVVVMSRQWGSVGDAPARFAQLSQELYQLESR